MVVLIVTLWIRNGKKSLQINMQKLVECKKIEFDQHFKHAVNFDPPFNKIVTYRFG